MNARVPHLFTSICLVLSVLIVGCATSISQAPRVTEIHVKLADFVIQIDKNSIPAGPVKFIVENGAKRIHEMVLEKAGDVDKALEANGKSAELADIAPGAIATMEWTIDKPGEYQIACHVQEEGIDHFMSGMQIPLTVIAK